MAPNLDKLLQMKDLEVDYEISGGKVILSFPVDTFFFDQIQHDVIYYLRYEQTRIYYSFENVLKKLNHIKILIEFYNTDDGSGWFNNKESKAKRID